MRSQIHIRVTDEQGVSQFACTLKYGRHTGKAVDYDIEDLLNSAIQSGATITPELNLADYTINGIKIEKTKDERTSNL